MKKIAVILDEETQTYTIDIYKGKEKLETWIRGDTKDELIKNIQIQINKYKTEYFTYSIVKQLEYLISIIRHIEDPAFTYKMEW